MNAMSKRLLAAVLSGAMLLPMVASAEAGPRHGWRDHERPHHHQRPHHRKHKNNNAGAAVAAGIIGLAAGAILLGATSRPSYAGPPPGPAYYPPAPYPPAPYPPAPYPPEPYQPAPYPGHVSAHPGFQPWSPAWYDYCASKYRSFNARTGTFTTYRGEQKFCQ